VDYLIFGISLVAAFIFSLGGVGAAIILVPIMSSLGIPMNVAKPVGLFYNTVSLTVAIIKKKKKTRLDFKVGIPIIISSFLFAILGAYISRFFSTKFIIILFVLFLLYASYMFLFHKKKKTETYRDDVPYVKLTLIGSFAGLLSGMLGIGGGNIISPLMLMIGFNPKKIAAITAFVVPFSSFSAFLTFLTMETYAVLLII